MSSPSSTADHLDPARRQKIAEIVAHSPRPQAAISDVLRLLQEALGHIDDHALEFAAQCTGLSPVQVEELCTFYPLVLREPAGRHVLRICDSISCHLAGARQLLTHAVAHSGVPMGRVAGKGAYTILPHVCLGLCAQAPAAWVDGKSLAPMDIQTLTGLLTAWEEKS